MSTALTTIHEDCEDGNEIAPIRLRLQITIQQHGRMIRYLGLCISSHMYDESAANCKGAMDSFGTQAIRLTQTTSMDELYNTVKRSIATTFGLSAAHFPDGKNAGESFGKLMVEFESETVLINEESWERIRSALIERDEQAELDAWFSTVPTVGAAIEKKRTKWQPSSSPRISSSRRATVPDVTPKRGLFSWWRRNRRVGSV